MSGQSFLTHDQINNPDGTAVSAANLSEHAPREEEETGLREEDFDLETDEVEEESAEPQEEEAPPVEEPTEDEEAEVDEEAAGEEERAEEELFELPEEFNIPSYGKVTRAEFVEALQFAATAAEKMQALEAKAISPEDERLLTLGKNFEKLLENEGFDKELTSRNTEPFRKAIEEARKGLEKRVRDPEVEELLVARREEKVNQQIDEIVGGLKKQYPDIVDAEFEQTVSQSVVESFKGHPRDVSLREVKATMTATAKLLEAARKKGAGAVTKALAKQPPGTKVVTRTSKRSAKPPEKKPGDLSEAEVSRMLEKAAFGES